jgi:2-amino-4-hydroxy-6-hydroxymethyldihydropteridine diphosphokinase
VSLQSVYLSLGSNLGDRESNLKKAVGRLSEHLLHMVASSLYETDPVGVTEQPQFLNLVIGGETDLAPRPMLNFVKSIERGIGRRRTFRWGPRIVDIDILILGDDVVNRKDLVIPHPELANRAFVLVPLSEIAPDTQIPGLHSTPARLLENRDAATGVLRLKPFQIPNRSSR